MTFTRITLDPDKMGGVPCIRGLRIPVVTVVEMVADGMDTEEILRAYPDLEPEVSAKRCVTLRRRYAKGRFRFFLLLEIPHR